MLWVVFFTFIHRTLQWTIISVRVPCVIMLSYSQNYVSWSKFVSIFGSSFFSIESVNRQKFLNVIIFSSLSLSSGKYAWSKLLFCQFQCSTILCECYLTIFISASTSFPISVLVKQQQTTFENHIFVIVGISYFYDQKFHFHKYK